MQKIEIFEAANMIVDIAQRICRIASTPWNSYELLPKEDQDRVDSHWQEISRISAEQAAKPEIQGVSLHG